MAWAVVQVKLPQDHLEKGILKKFKIDYSDFFVKTEPCLLGVMLSLFFVLLWLLLCCCCVVVLV